MTEKSWLQGQPYLLSSDCQRAILYGQLDICHVYEISYAV